MARKKKPDRSPLLVTMPKHLYRGDGVPDHRGYDRCGDCGLGREHAVHELPGTDPAVSEVEQRRIGESGDR